MRAILEPGITLVLGPMFAGKTTRMVEYMRLADDVGLRTVIVRPAIDTRGRMDSVYMHGGGTHPAVTCMGMDSLRHAVRDAEVIGVDEVQFWGDTLPATLNEYAKQGRAIVCAGLSATFDRRPFGVVSALLCYASGVEFLTASCVYCQGPAMFTRRKAGHKTTVMIGGPEMYDAVCRAHWEDRSATECSAHDSECMCERSERKLGPGKGNASEAEARQGAK